MKKKMPISVKIKVVVLDCTAYVLDKVCVVTRHNFCMTLGKYEFACTAKIDYLEDLYTR
jgi:hypothetical protein